MNRVLIRGQKVPRQGTVAPHYTPVVGLPRGTFIMVHHKLLVRTPQHGIRVRPCPTKAQDRLPAGINLHTVGKRLKTELYLLPRWILEFRIRQGTLASLAAKWDHRQR